MEYDIIPAYCIPNVYSQWKAIEDRKNVIMIYPEEPHCGLLTIEKYLIPDINTSSATVIYRYFNYDVNYEIAAKIIIDDKRKVFYVKNLLMRYNFYWDAIPTWKGGLKAFKRLRDKEHIIASITTSFFGTEWRCYLGFKRPHIKSLKRSYLRLLRQMPLVDQLTSDLESIIVDHSVENLLDTPNITLDDFNKWIHLAESTGGFHHKNRYTI